MRGRWGRGVKVCVWGEGHWELLFSHHAVSQLSCSPQCYFIVEVFPHSEGRDYVRGFLVRGGRGNGAIRLDGSPARHLADIHHLRSCSQGIHDYKSSSFSLPFRYSRWILMQFANSRKFGCSNCDHFPQVM